MRNAIHVKYPSNSYPATQIIYRFSQLACTVGYRDLDCPAVPTVSAFTALLDLNLLVELETFCLMLRMPRKKLLFSRAFADMGFKTQPSISPSLSPTVSSTTIQESSSAVNELVAIVAHTACTNGRSQINFSQYPAQSANHACAVMGHAKNIQVYKYKNRNQTLYAVRHHKDRE